MSENHSEEHESPIKTPKPILDFLGQKLNETVQSEVFKSRMAALGMTVPDAKDNTPENFAAFMRKAMEFQGELAKLSGHQPLAPAR